RTFSINISLTRSSRNGTCSLDSLGSSNCWAFSHGRMGRYGEATAIALQTGMPADIAAVRTMHIRGGVSLNLEQQLTEGLGLVARAGWSQGQLEAFDFTDINTTISLGLSINGVRWGRPDDTVGVAIAVDGASGNAKQFFAAGGLG